MFVFVKNVTNLHSTKIRNIFYGDKTLNREGCTAMRPRNTGLSIFLGKIRPHRIGRDPLYLPSILMKPLTPVYYHPKFLSYSAKSKHIHKCESLTFLIHMWKFCTILSCSSFVHVWSNLYHHWQRVGGLFVSFNTGMSEGPCLSLPPLPPTPWSRRL